MSESQTASRIPVAIAELSTDAPLAFDLLDESGRPLARSGQTLTENLLKTLGARELFRPATDDDAVTGDAEEMDSPDAVIATLEELEQRKPGSSNKKRLHDRHAWCVAIKVQLLEPTGTWSQDVTTCDLSKGGFAFISHRLVHTGTKLTTTFDMLPNKPRLAGIVRSCIYIQPSQYRVGVQFHDPKADK